MFIIYTLNYAEGMLAVSDTHLLVCRTDKTIREKFARLHITSPLQEIGFSFRHPLLGLIASIVLMGYSIFLCLGISFDLPGIGPRVGTYLLISIPCAFGFSLLFLWGVITNRSIPWIVFRYGGVLRRIPLPDANIEEIEKVLEILSPPPPNREIK